MKGRQSLFGFRRRHQPATAYRRIASFADEATAGTALARMLDPPPEEVAATSGFRLLATGMEAFLMRGALAELAERTLDLQYYIYRDDDTGALLTQALIEAADRGVRVRLLVDDLNLAGRDEDVAALDGHPHIEVRIFNPFIARHGSPWSRLANFLADPLRLNRRMHNKSFIADNQCAIVGGRNVGDEYFDASRDFGFGDLDMLAAGPITRDISRSFDEYWNSAYSYPLATIGWRVSASGWMERLRNRLGRHFRRMRESAYAEGLRQTDLAAQLMQRRLALVRAPARLVADHPAKIEGGPPDGGQSPIDQLRELTEQARSEIILVSPYFVPGPEGLAVLRAIRARHVRVRLLTNSLASSDVAAVHAGYSRYRHALLAMGVELHELKPIMRPAKRRRKVIFGSARASLHAKAFVFDRKQAVIGSLNLDPRSVYLNTEMALVIDSPILAGEIGDAFDELVDPEYSYRVELDAASPTGLKWSGHEDGHALSFRHDPQASRWRRVAATLLGWLPIEDQL